jgi:hypothetical protein
MSEEDSIDWLWFRKSLFGDGFGWESTDALEELVDSLMALL